MCHVCLPWAQFSAMMVFLCSAIINIRLSCTCSCMLIRWNWMGLFALAHVKLKIKCYLNPTPKTNNLKYFKSDTPLMFNIFFCREWMNWQSYMIEYDTCTASYCLKHIHTEYGDLNWFTFMIVHSIFMV